MSRQPDGPPPPPVVQRLRVRYAKRGPMRFTSHRDFARAFERALRRGAVPVAFSAGFHPHPKVSYAGAAPTGVASEAEYLEIGLAERRDPAAVREALDAALPPGLDVVDVVQPAPGAPPLADLATASRWRIELPEVPVSAADEAVTRLLALATAPVQRATKDGHRTVDVRAAVLRAVVEETREPAAAEGAPYRDDTATNCGYAIIDLVVQHLTPAVRPDDVLTALRDAAHLTTPITPRVTRLAQGVVDEAAAPGEMRLSDPLAPADEPIPRPTDDVAAAAPS
jgi:radical SAM-linked protein